MITMERLRYVRDELIEMIEEPSTGFGIEIADRGLDLNAETAEFVMHLHDGDYEVTIRKVSS